MTGRQLIALRVARRADWEEIVREVAGEGVAGAARAVGVGLRTMGRWFAELGLAHPRGGKRANAGRKKIVSSHESNATPDV